MSLLGLCSLVFYFLGGAMGDATKSDLSCWCAVIGDLPNVVLVSFGELSHYDLCRTFGRNVMSEPLKI